MPPPTVVGASLAACAASTTARKAGLTGRSLISFNNWDPDCPAAVVPLGGPSEFSWLSALSLESLK
eukprot:scaffold1951_cov258-Pinguiococcus_pyrenoidosus.AAC.8